MMQRLMSATILKILRRNQISSLVTALPLIQNERKASALRLLSTEIIRTAAPRSQGNEDVLNNQLEKAASTEKLLSLVKIHHSVMNNDHLLKTLYLIYVNHRDGETAENFKFVASPSFQQLCHRLQKRARYYAVEDVINVLKYLSYLGMPSTSLIMTSYFQILRHQLNDLSLKQILYMNFLLSKQESMPLVDALSLALPIVLENQLDIQLSSATTMTNLDLVRLFEYAADKSLSHKTLQKLADIILQSETPLDSREAFILLWASLKCHHFFTHDVLFDKAVKVLLEVSDKLTPYRLILALKLLIKQRKHFQHEELFLKASKRALEEPWPFITVHGLVDTLTRSTFVNLELLDKYAIFLEKNKDELMNNSKLSIYNIVDSFAVANYAPENFNKVLDNIFHCKEKLEILKSVPHLMTRFAVNFAILKKFPQEIFDYVLSDEFLRNVIASLDDSSHPPEYHKHNLKYLGFLNQVSHILGRPLSLPESLKPDIISLDRSFDYPLQKALEIGLGSSNYVVTGLITKSDVIIDHLIVLRKGNYPVAVSVGTESSVSGNLLSLHCAEDVLVPEDAFRVAILVRTKSYIAMNNDRITGAGTLASQLLTAEGYIPLIIPITVWEKLLEHEKIPYLMREIKQCCQTDLQEDISM